MNKIIIIMGLGVVWAFGYVTLSAYQGRSQMGLLEKAILSPVFFFNTVAVLYLGHLVSGGLVLSSKGGCLSLLVIYFAVHLIWGRSNICGDLVTLRCFPIERLQKTIVLKGIVFAVLIVVTSILAVEPMLSGMRLGGDLKRHLLWANQLSNGFLFLHFPPYEGVMPAVHYPFLTHVSLLSLKNFLNVHIFDAFLILHAFQAFILPLGVFFLVRKLTANYWVALMAAVLITLYGGYEMQFSGESWWFNTALQRLVPNHITRMLAIGMVPFFLYLFVKAFENKEKGFPLLGSTLVLGYMGLCHTYAFVFTCTFIVVYFVIAGKDWVQRKKLLAILAGGVLLSLLAYIPTILNFISQHQAINAPFQENPSVQFFSGPIGQVLFTWKRFVNSYGMVGVLAFCSLIFLRKARYRGIYCALIISVATVLCVTYLKEIVAVFTNLQLPYHPTQQKFGKPIFLSLVILSSLFLGAYMDWARKHKSGKRLLLRTAVMVPILYFGLAGFQTTFLFLNKPWFKNWRMAQANEAFREESNIVNRIRMIAKSGDVVAVPENIGDTLCHLSGLDVLYVWHPKIYSHHRKFSNRILFASDALRSAVERKGNLKFSEIMRAVLRQYGVTYMVVSKDQNDRYAAFGFLKTCGSGLWKDGKEYLILEVVQSELIEPGDLQAKRRIMDFSSDVASYGLVVGYYPLLRERYVRPKLLHSRGLKASGLAWANDGFWIAYENQNRLYKLDSENGKILSVLAFKNTGFKGLAWDGKNLWCVDGGGSEICKIDGETGEVVKRIKGLGNGLTGLAWGDGHLWTINSKKKEIWRVNSVTGKIVSNIPVHFVPKGIAWHRGTLWITQGRGRIFRIEHGRLLERAYYSPPCMIERIAWKNNNLWAFDGRSSSLVEFCSFGSRLGVF